MTLADGTPIIHERFVNEDWYIDSRQGSLLKLQTKLVFQLHRKFPMFRVKTDVFRLLRSLTAALYLLIFSLVGQRAHAIAVCEMLMGKIPQALNPLRPTMDEVGRDFGNEPIHGLETVAQRLEFRWYVNLTLDFRDHFTNMITLFPPGGFTVTWGLQNRMLLSKAMEDLNRAGHRLLLGLAMRDDEIPTVPQPKNADEWYSIFLALLSLDKSGVRALQDQGNPRTALKNHLSSVLDQDRKRFFAVGLAKSPYSSLFGPHYSARDWGLGQAFGRILVAVFRSPSYSVSSYIAEHDGHHADRDQLFPSIVEISQRYVYHKVGLNFVYQGVNDAFPDDQVTEFSKWTTYFIRNARLLIPQMYSPRQAQEFWATVDDTTYDTHQTVKNRGTGLWWRDWALSQSHLGKEEFIAEAVRAFFEFKPETQPDYITIERGWGSGYELALAHALWYTLQTLKDNPVSGLQSPYDRRVVLPVSP